jgi:hypothetical protein
MERTRRMIKKSKKSKKCKICKCSYNSKKHKRTCKKHSRTNNKRKRGGGYGGNNPFCNDPNFSIFNTNLLKLFPYKT